MRHGLTPRLNCYLQPVLHFLPTRWISVLNNAKEAVLMKAFGESSGSESNPMSQSVKELTRTIIQETRRLPGNRMCCDCSAPGKSKDRKLSIIVLPFLNDLLGNRASSCTNQFITSNL